MRIFLTFLLILLLPSLATAGDCDEAMTTAEISECLQRLSAEADSVLAVYLDEIRDKLGEGEARDALDRAQALWVEFREADARAGYEAWGDGSMRLIEWPATTLNHTRRRVWDLWQRHLQGRVTDLPEPTWE